jgi:hypothetical protein
MARTFRDLTHVELDLPMAREELEMTPRNVTASTLWTIGEFFCAAAVSNLNLRQSISVLELQRTMRNIHPSLRRSIQQIACRRTISAAVTNAEDTIVGFFRSPGEKLWSDLQFEDKNAQEAVDELVGPPEWVTTSSLMTAADMLRSACRDPTLSIRRAIEVIYLTRIIKEGIFPIVNCVHPLTSVGLKRFTCNKEILAASDEAINCLIVALGGQTSPRLAA